MIHSGQSGTGTDFTQTKNRLTRGQYMWSVPRISRQPAAVGAVESQLSVWRCREARMATVWSLNRHFVTDVALSLTKNLLDIYRTIEELCMWTTDWINISSELGAAEALLKEAASEDMIFKPAEKNIQKCSNCQNKNSYLWQRSVKCFCMHLLVCTISIKYLQVQQHCQPYQERCTAP